MKQQALLSKGLILMLLMPRRFIKMPRPCKLRRVCPLWPFASEHDRTFPVEFQLITLGHRFLTRGFPLLVVFKFMKSQTLLVQPILHLSAIAVLTWTPLGRTPFFPDKLCNPLRCSPWSQSDSDRTFEVQFLPVAVSASLHDLMPLPQEC